MGRVTREVVVLLMAFAAGATALRTWLSARDDQRKLKTTIAEQNKLIAAADTRQTERERSLQDALAAIERLKKQTRTPAQVVQQLPQYLSLPHPIALQTPVGNILPQGSSSILIPRALRSATVDRASHSPSSVTNEALPENVPTASNAPGFALAPQNVPDPPTVDFPADDLKPLFDFVQTDRECQLQLQTARQKAADDQGKIQALALEKDKALAFARGGARWHRTARALKWLAVGAAASYLSSRN